MKMIRATFLFNFHTFSDKQLILYQNGYLSLSNYQRLPLQLSDNKQGIKAINNCGSHDHKFCQIRFCRIETKSLVTS